MKGTRPRSRNPFAWGAGTTIAALVCGAVGAAFVLPMGLGLDERVHVPLLFIVVAMLSSLGASWAGTALATDGTRSRMLPIVGSSVATAVILLLLSLTVLWSRSPSSSPYPVLLVSPLIVIASIWATGHFRERRSAADREGLWRLLLFLSTIAVIILTGYLASLFGLAGP